MAKLIKFDNEHTLSEAKELTNDNPQICYLTTDGYIVFNNIAYYNEYNKELANVIKDIRELELYIDEELNKKQNKLISGNNIATINNETILKSGDLQLATKKDLSDFIRHVNELELIVGEELDKKQDKLVAGENILNINNETILNSGNLELATPDIIVKHYTDSNSAQNAWCNSNMLLVQNNKNLIDKKIIKFGWHVHDNSGLSDGEFYCCAMTNDSIILKYSKQKLRIKDYVGRNIIFDFDEFSFPKNATVWGFALIADKVEGNIYPGAVKNYPNMRPSINNNVAAESNMCIINTGNWYNNWEAVYSIEYVETIFDIVNKKQDKLVDGINIKTIHGDSILGSGNIENILIIDYGEGLNFTKLYNAINNNKLIICRYTNNYFIPAQIRYNTSTVIAYFATQKSNKLYVTNFSCNSTQTVWKDITEIIFIDKDLSNISDTGKQVIKNIVKETEWYGTQEEFDAIVEYDENIKYYIYD